MNEIHDTREKRDHNRGRTQGLGRKSSGESEKVEWEVFGREKIDFISREIKEKWRENRDKALYREHKAQWIESYWELPSTNS